MFWVLDFQTWILIFTRARLDDQFSLFCTEHRNMPVDDALRLIDQNFQDYVKKIRLRNMREVVPREIRNLMCDLLENRALSMGDLDKIIKYLKERQSFLVDDQIEQKRETASGKMNALGIAFHCFNPEPSCCAYNDLSFSLFEGIFNFTVRRICFILAYSKADVTW